MTEKERKILDMYFGLNGNNSHTLTEIGKMLGISRERIRQIKNNALEKMKNCSNRNNFEAEDYISNEETFDVNSYRKARRAPEGIMY